MRIHSTVDNSRVNGPGRRGVLWVQGCSLECRECWNPETHARDIGREMDHAQLMQWVDSLRDIDGITISGGEPMQQADELGVFLYGVRTFFPRLTMGMFSGYSDLELEVGRYDALQGASDAGRVRWWALMKGVLDFAVLGRFNVGMPARSPMITSSNQKLLLYSNRLALEDFGPQRVEISLSPNGRAVETGFPTRGNIAIA